MAIQNVYGNADLFNAALLLGLRHRAGDTIFKYLSKCEYDVVVYPPGITAGQMLVSCDPGDGSNIAQNHYATHTQTTVVERPTVFWNPHYEFEFFGDVDNVDIAKGGTCAARDVKKVLASSYIYKTSAPLKAGGNIKFETSVIRYTKAAMPPWVVLFHELGHTKQFFEGGDNEETRTAAWKIRLANLAGIEADNLAHHENPICRDAGIPIRVHYKHMGLGLEEELTKKFKDKPRIQPALRVADNSQERLRQDAELEAFVLRDAGKQEGFFRGNG